MEHCPPSRLGVHTLKTWASEFGMLDAADLFDATLKEEKATAPSEVSGGLMGDETQG